MSKRILVEVTVSDDVRKSYTDAGIEDAIRGALDYSEEQVAYYPSTLDMLNDRSEIRFFENVRVLNEEDPL